MGLKIIKKICTAPVKYIPSVFYPVYASRLGRQIKKKFNLSRGIFCLSFDNDYRADNVAAELLLPELANRNIPVTWAVIGKWVEEFKDFHLKAISAGHELMNHSWSHPDSPELRPEDARKFDSLSDLEVFEEINKNHDFCFEHLNYKMKGFRFPHFRFHPAAKEILKKLGYEYTSNEFSMDSSEWGVPYKNEILEIPLAGIPRRPGRTVESYRLFRNPDGLYKNEDQFFLDFESLLHATEKYGLVTCIYLDAIDMAQLKRPHFNEYLDTLCRHDIDVLTYGEVARRLNDGAFER
ncbi:MAG: Polysaccharide deacetylase [Bacteriovoracaceae bacterium]|nr:Polysaccharide deacetylase [Bacteriovoracaceae bacterium]